MKCPCNHEKEFQKCCEPLIRGDRKADSPEELMRSRYSAFATKAMDYIEETTDPQARVEFDRQANEEWARSANFTNLEILKSTNEGNKGTVEFKATFQIGNEPPQVHHEVSKFRKQAGTWYFRDGLVKK